MIKLAKHLCFPLLIQLLGCATNPILTESTAEFDKVNKSTSWQLELSDSCTGNWQDNWFMDGKFGKVEQRKTGMHFKAGSVNRDDAHHAVLWTKKSFKGDLKLEYSYTKTDTQLINVNILYLQATGVGIGVYDKDISNWNGLRDVPTMSKYYYNMNALHISYAAFEVVNSDPLADYIRVRHYPSLLNQFDKTEIAPAYFKTGLFQTGETYKITIIKTQSKLYFQAVGKKRKQLYTWNLTDAQTPMEGRIGLRHMYTRSANYKDIKVSVKSDTF